MIIIEKEVFILYLPMDEKKLVKVQGCSHKRNARREYERLETKQSDYSTYSSYQEMRDCRRKCKLNIQIH